MTTQSDFDFDAALDAFHERVQSALRKIGVDTLGETVLKADAEGRIVVAENHPDRAAIEKLFRDNPELVEQFQQLANHAARPDGETQFQLRLTLFGPEVEFV